MNPGQRGGLQYDFAVYDSQGRLSAAVEVKRRFERDSAAPDWTLDAGPLLAPYFARLKIPVAEVHPHVFEEIVAFWLRDAVQGAMPDGSIIEGAEGLLDALRGGEVVQQVAA